MKIMGVDPGLANTGWAILDGDMLNGTIEMTDFYGVIKTRKWTNEKIKTGEIPIRDRLDMVGEQIQDIICAHEPRFIVMEDFVFFGNKGKTTSQMPALIESLRIVSKNLGYEAVILSNGTWKKVLLNNHTANKNQIQHYVHRYLQLDTAYWDKHDKGGHIRDSMAVALTQWKILQQEQKKGKQNPNVGQYQYF